MMESDVIQQVGFDETNARGALVRLSASYKAVLERHDYPLPIKILLGEALAAAALLTSTIKFEGSLILQLQNAGPISLLVVQCDQDFHVRAIARHDEEDLMALQHIEDEWHQGVLSITIETNQNNMRYQGIVPLSHGGLAHCIEQYFAQSEQISTKVWLTANGYVAAGFLLQAMPTNTSDVISMEWEHLVHLGATITPHELQALSFRDILHRLYHSELVILYEAVPVSFRCTCSRERVTETLHTLGKDEAVDIIKEQKQVSITCQFCYQEYHFDAVDIEQIFNEQFIHPHTDKYV